MIRIAPEGWPFVLPAACLTLLSAVATWLTWGHPGPWRTGSLAGLAVLGITTGFVGFFFRNPVRRRPQGSNQVLAPADGRVVQIEDVEEPVFLQGRARRISIFLSIFNVHIQRAPIAGRVGHRSYKPGGFAAAWNPKASEENEQASLGIESGPHRVLVRQIAGLVARRVVTDPREGDPVAQGSRIGIIRFGSRVDLFVPPSWETSCRVGDRVKAGVTVMARTPEAPPPPTREVQR